jgi:hypothetical protein
MHMVFPLDQKCQKKIRSSIRYNLTALQALQDPGKNLSSLIHQSNNCHKVILRVPQVLQALKMFSKKYLTSKSQF